MTGGLISPAATLVSIQVGLARDHGSSEGVEPWERPWRSSIVKDPVEGPVRLTALSLEGDSQVSEGHGGLDQALLCYSADHYPGWRRELGIPDMPHGGFGENFTISGIDEATVCIGDVYEVGPAAFEVSRHRGPCYKLAYRWGRHDLLSLVESTGRQGWYARVLQEGMVEAGLEVVLANRPFPQWTVERASRVYQSRATDPASAAQLAEVEALPNGLRTRLGAGN